MKNKMSLHLIFSSSSPVRNHAVTVVYLFLLSAPFAGAQSGNSPQVDQYNLNPKFSPSMVITIIVLICAFFFMAFFSVYVRQCGERNGGSIRQAIRATGRSRRAPRGLDQDVIDTFPTFLYSVVKGLKIGKGTLECAVCLNEFEDDETLRLLPKCDHVFHPDCIDAWLASHTTCPVCRANLVPEPGEVAAGDSVIEIPDSAIESDEENRNELERGILRNQGSIRLIDGQSRDLGLPDVINPNQIPIQNRPGRSKSTRFRLSGKFPRSHSTGHSIVQPGDNCERFTLKLPEDVRKQIMNGKLHRTTSCVVFPTEGSSRRGYRSGSVGSNRGKSYSFRRLDEPAARSDRWVFSRQPPFFTRASSVRSLLRVNPAEGESASTSKSLFTSVKTPFDCLGPKVDGADQSSPARPLV